MNYSTRLGKAYYSFITILGFFNRDTSIEVHVTLCLTGAVTARKRGYGVPLKHLLSQFFL
jgi:hypothetical protein